MRKFIFTIFLKWKYRFVDDDLCMCGANLSQHGYNDNHGFVQAKEYVISNELKWMLVGGRLK